MNVTKYKQSTYFCSLYFVAILKAYFKLILDSFFSVHDYDYSCNRLMKINLRIKVNTKNIGK